MNRLRLMVLMAALVCLVPMRAALAQNIAVVSGNGQVLTPSNLLAQQMVVRVTDANGTPAAGVTVNWAITTGNGIFLVTGTSQAATTTDQNGQTSIFFNPGLAIQTNFLLPYVQTLITASPATNTAANVTFALTQVVSAANPGGVSPGVYISTTIPDSLQGAAGSRGSTPIQVIVQASNGAVTAVIPKAAVQLLNYQDPSSGAAITCVPSGAQSGANTVLTDSLGNASCTPLFGGVPGTGQGAVAVGGVPSATATPFGIWQLRPDPSDPTIPPIQASGLSSVPFRFTVTPGAVGSIKSTSGSNQSANPGQSLPAALVAEVDSASGQPLAGIPVTWTANPAGAVNFVNKAATSDVNGKVSANVAFTGSAAGAVQVTVSWTSDSTKSATFNITAVPIFSITGFSIVSGSNQSAAVNTAFAQPLIVQVTSSTGSAAGIPILFGVSSGSVALSATAANTDANGRAQINVTAGSNTGAATVTASVSGNAGVGTQVFNLTVLPAAPTLTAANFVNGADLQGNSLSPCSLGAIQAPLGTLGATGSAPTLPGFPLSSSSVKLTIGSLSAPILGVGVNSNNRDEVKFQVPCGVTPGAPVPATLTVGGGTSNINLTIQAASPGIFNTVNSDGVFRAVLIRPDGSFVSLENPARRGETEVAYATGLGPTSPGVATPSAYFGISVPSPSSSAGQVAALVPLGSVIVGMAGGGVPLNWARLSDLPGVFLVSFQIPADMQTGNNVTFSIGLVPQGASSAVYSGTTKIPVQ